MTATVTDWGDAMVASGAAAMAMFFAAIPRVLGFIIILVVGWFIATLIAKAIQALLRAVNFNGLADRAGLTDFVKRMGVKTDASEFLANIAKWFIRLIVMVVAFDALGLPAVSSILSQFLLWIPNLVVALVVLVLGGLAAKAVDGLVRGATAEAGFTNPNMIARIATTAVWIFTIVIAVNQIGIAVALVNTLFMGFIGALALALGLAFGIGGRETAAKIVNRWYDESAGTARKIETAADAASRNMNER
ncbi:MAG: small-conductance mechanosensitive ion channel [Pseudomonadota bacterium]